jgi:membrane fusion protein (multidrug efflux system)
MTATATNLQPAVQQRSNGSSADGALPPVPGATASPVTPPPVRRRKAVVLTIITIIVATGLGIGIPLLIAAANVESTDDAFIDADVVRAAPQVAGRVLAVAVDDNQLVERGHLLVQIDPRDYQVKVQDAKAGLAEAQGKLDQANAQLNVTAADADQADAQVGVARANATNAAEDLHRYTTLEARAISQQMKDAATAAAHSTAAALTAAERKAASARAQVEFARTQIATAAAAVDTAKAKLDQANLDLSYTELRAAIDGRVTRKSVQPGNYLQVGQQVLALVPTDVYVTANFKETQLEHMHGGEPVEIDVDAYPHHPFHGHVDSLQAGTGAAFSLLPPENATGNYVKVVQRVPVKIRIDDKFDPAYPLAPGMSVEPDVRVR